MSRKKELKDEAPELHQPLTEATEAVEALFALVPEPWTDKPESAGLYFQVDGCDLVTRIVRQRDIDSGFFSRSGGRWFKLPVPMP